MDARIGITTTVPVEIIFAAGLKPVDLNNLFIGSAQYSEYLDAAERAGFPKSLCSWIKGIYGAAMAEGIRRIVGVIEGDCSNTGSLTAVLETEGVDIIPFGYPHSRERAAMEAAIKMLAGALNVELAEAEKWRGRLNEVRALAREVDRLTWEEGRISGQENHIAQVSLSDFNGGDLEGTESDLRSLIEEAGRRSPHGRRLRIGTIGVPPMTLDLFETVESFEAAVVYNEVQREFAFPRFESSPDLAAQYLDYTYPYSVGMRIGEIRRQIELREIDALIHYTQSFCHRGLDDIVIRRSCDIPVLTIEGDRSNCLDARTKLRLEAFLDMLADTKLRGVRF